MVDFNTRIFSEDDGRIIGAEITVLSTSGDNLGSISVANAETLAEMQAQLAVIDETYFTEERLEEILENISENTTINATQLNGFLSSDFAKASQLSNYAPVSHNHSVSQINGLYDYQIYASNYNVNIDSTVNIIVKVTNRATGNPVVGVTVPVLKNNESWQSGTTGVNGTFSLSYTADTWGLTTFSAKTQNCQINVKGWRSAGNSDFSIRYNQDTVQLQINVASTNFPVQFQSFTGQTIPNNLKPATPVISPCYNNTNLLVAVNPSTGEIQRRSMTGNGYTGACSCNLTWSY